MGSMVVDLGLGICKHKKKKKKKKKTREGEERVAKFVCVCVGGRGGGGGGGGGEGTEQPFGYLKDSKIVPATPWHRALRCGERMAKQRRRALRCCIPKSWIRATQLRRDLRRGVPESREQGF